MHAYPLFVPMATVCGLLLSACGPSSSSSAPSGQAAGREAEKRRENSGTQIQELNGQTTTEQDASKENAPGNRKVGGLTGLDVSK